ncbi:MAG: polysaccharide biosynthesis protein [Deltaproteobacteria bacterium]|nr:polysaccharide biosynthesis protein [Deltaproteobacteria bacterium]
MDSINILKRLMASSAFRVTLLASNIAVSFYMMPFLIHSLGDRLYGFWSLVGIFIGYYGFLDLGLSSAVSRFISRAYGQKNPYEINIVLNTALALFLIIGIIAFLFSCAAAVFCGVFIKDYAEAALFRKIVLILGGNVALGFPMRVFTGILFAKLRHDLIAYTDFFKLIIRTVLIVYFITNGYGLLALAWITFLVQVIGYLINFYFVKSNFPQIKINTSLFKASRIKQLFNYSSFTFISQVADLLRFKVDEFVVGYFLNLSFVTHYTIGARLIEYFVQFMLSAIGFMSPVYSQFEGRGDFKSIKKWFLQATKISTFLSVFVGASFLYYGKPFIIRWMGLDYVDSYNVIAILTVGVTVGLMQTPSISLLYGISKHKYYAVSNTCEGVLNLILSIILVKYYGIYGVAMGTMIEMLIFKLLIQPVYTCRVIKLSLYEYYFKTIFMTAAKTLLPILAYFYLLKDFLKPAYINILSISFLQVILFIPISFFTMFDKTERAYIRNALLS